MDLDLFSPFGGNTTAVSCSATTASGALDIPTGLRGSASLRVYNGASVVVFIRFGTSAVTAATTDMPIPPGAVEMFDISPTVTHIAGITASGTGTLYATTGGGA